MNSTDFYVYRNSSLCQKNEKRFTTLMRAFNQIPSGSVKFFNFPKIVGDTFCHLNHHFRGLRSISDLFVEETA